MKSKRRHIELFAGCGGLALGMEKAGFELSFANELSPMAAQTFALNILDTDLDEGISEKVLWLSSMYDRSLIKSRFRENPFEALYGEYHDINEGSDLRKKLIVGDVRQLKDYLKSFKNLLEPFNNIDLLSGGPPCQGFSLAGRRIRDDYKNRLPLTFAEVAAIIKPKVVLLENVKGITSPFVVNNVPYYAWIEVSKAFALESYVPVCMMINSRYFGVPQNRPRFIMLAFREDVFNKLIDIGHQEIIGNSWKFYQEVRRDQNRAETENFADFKYFDIEDKNDLKYFDGKLLPRARTYDKSSQISVLEAIDDLKNIGSGKPTVKVSEYVKGLNNQFLKPNKNSKFSNHELRSHNSFTKSRFRFYQILSALNGIGSELEKVLKDKEFLKEISENDKMNAFNTGFKNQMVVLSNGSEKRINKYSEFIAYLKELPETKKHSQRALIPDNPAPAQLTIPDDMCHYDRDHSRTLTVREMARIQSFPDWFEFKSKATTGGKNRSFEVPQYTQVGNAVPPLLALELGKLISDILEQIDE